MTEFSIRAVAQLPTLLQGFRKAAGLSQADVAARLGITQQTLSAMERNAARMSVGRLVKLLDVLAAELVLRSAAAPPERPRKPKPSSW